METLFFDTYALFEILAGNPRYHPYTKGVAMVTTRMNLLELHYGLLLQQGRDAADKTYDGLVGHSVEPDDADPQERKRVPGEHA